MIPHLRPTHRLHRRGHAAIVAFLVIATLIVPPLTDRSTALAAICENTSVGFVPLSDTRSLYAGGNTMPAGHARAAPDVVPVGGVIGVISLGMSNGLQEWNAFMQTANNDPTIAPTVRFGNGSVPGQTMSQWANRNSGAWTTAVSSIARDGVTPNQVQVVWMKMGSKLAELDGTQAQRIERERAWLDAVITNAADVFPNLRRVYISSRIYVGYGMSPNHAEPQTGYDNGLSVQAIVADAVAGKTAVWTAWGPYLWADGTTQRSDGLSWACSDFESDGVHPSTTGEQKVANQLLAFFSSEKTACEWFLDDPSKCGQISPPRPGGPPVVGNTVGLVDSASGMWYLYDGLGKLMDSFFFGNPGDVPFMGDWDGDGVETPGLYRQSDGFVYLRNSNSEGIADIQFFFGNPGDVPLAGDFNGDGFDTVSIYRPSNQTFYIINELGENNGGLGGADVSYVFGDPGDKPFVGDFDGDGIETVGLHRESTGLVYFRNSHTQGIADNQFIFGDPGDRLVAGDWTDDGVFTPALFRPSDTTLYFRYTNTQGAADNQFVPSPVKTPWLPISGNTD